MGRIILTGISFKNHKFLLSYIDLQNNQRKCFANCTCGFEVEIFHFESWGGSRQVQFEWDQHIKSVEKYR